MSKIDNETDPVLEIPGNFHEDDELAQLQNSDDIDKLRSVLKEDEVVYRLVLCFHEESDGVLAATNKRIIFADKRFITSKVVSFKYSEVATLIYSTELMMQTITLAHHSGALTVDRVQKDHGERFIEFVRDVIGQDYSSEGKGGHVFSYNSDLLELSELPSQDQ